MSDSVKEDYLLTLEDLRDCALPIINSLSSLARDYIDDAPQIADAICEHILKCSPSMKLPAFYLLDNITKNVGPPYPALLAPHIYALFTQSYTVVSSAIRHKLEVLYGTWKLPIKYTQRPPFPEDVMAKIGVFLAKVSEINANAISVDSLLARINKLLPVITGPKHGVLVQLGQALEHNQIPANMMPDIEKQLEVFESKRNFGTLPNGGQASGRIGTHYDQRDQGNHFDQQRKPAVSASSNGQSLTPSFQGSALNALLSLGGKENHKPTASVGLSPDILSTLSSAVQTAKQQTPTPPPTGAPSLPSNLSSILSSLQSSALFKPAIMVELSNSALNAQHPELIDRLYKDFPKICSTCGKRYPDTVEGDREREAHIDWHFRSNKRLMDDKRTQNREWYLPLDRWITFKDEDVVVGVSVVDKKEPEPEMSLQELQAQYVIAPKETSALARAPCPICQEKFESVWNDTAENWVWMNAVRADKRIYHATCRAESLKAKEKEGTLSARSTPPVGLDFSKLSSLKRKLDGEDDSVISIKREKIGV